MLQHCVETYKWPTSSSPECWDGVGYWTVKRQMVANLRLLVWDGARVPRSQGSSLKPIDFCLRCSQSCFEQLLLCNEFGQDRGKCRCLRLLKVLRDIVFPDTENEVNDNMNNSGYWLFDVYRATDPLKKTGKLENWFPLTSSRRWCYLNGRRIPQRSCGPKRTWVNLFLIYFVVLLLVWSKRSYEASFTQTTIYFHLR